MTWDLKRRESLTDYNLERFQIKIVSNLTSGDQIGWLSNFFFFFFFFPFCPLRFSFGILNIGLCGFGG